MSATLLVRLLIAIMLSVISPLARAAITTTGDVTPAPPAGGGNVVGPFNVGNNGVGTMSISGGTALTSTATAFVGNGGEAVGIVTMSGLGSDWTLTSAGADLFVGNLGVGAITLSNFAKLTVADILILGNAGGTGQGQINVTGLGSILDVANDVIVGGNGRGILEVASGGQVFSQDTTLGNGSLGDGRITVSGELSSWQITGALTVGSIGNSRGALLVESGGRVVNTGASTIGDGSNTSGVVEVSGLGSWWHAAGSVVVGDGGVGTVRVLDGGRVTTDGVTLGNLAGSRGQVLVDGADSLWNIDGSLIGSIEDSTITISNGGVIRTSVVPNFSAKTHIRLDGGRLESTSAGNISSSGFLEGSGTIEAGGLNLFGSTSTLYGGPGDHLVVTSFVSVGGHLDLNGGQLVTGTGVQIVVNGNAGLRNGGTLRAGGTGLQIFNGAQFAVTGGQGDIFGAVSNSAGGEIAVVGDSIAVFHDAVTNNGTIFVAPGSQMVTLEDLGFAAGSALSVQLSTVDPDEDAAEGFGQAITSGQTTLAGSLDVSLVGGFQPQLEDTFQIVTAGGGRSGAFATESLPALSGFLGWDVVYSSNAVTLAVVPALLGDYNANGIVDAADYVVWRKTLSQSGIALAADGNRSGTIDSGDYDVWRTQFGQSIVFGSGAAASSAPPFSSTVPEPESALLLVIVVVEMYCRARRLRRQ